jgi:hypothetical protein
MRVTCPAHLSLIDFITLTIFGERSSYEAPHYEVSQILNKAVNLSEIYILSRTMYYKIQRGVFLRISLKLDLSFIIFSQ